MKGAVRLCAVTEGPRTGEGGGPFLGNNNCLRPWDNEAQQKNQGFCVGSCTYYFFMMNQIYVTTDRRFILSIKRGWQRGALQSGLGRDVMEAASVTALLCVCFFHIL